MVEQNQFKGSSTLGPGNPEHQQRQTINRKFNTDQKKEGWGWREGQKRIHIALSEQMYEPQLNRRQGEGILLSGGVHCQTVAENDLAGRFQEPKQCCCWYTTNKRG